MVSMLASSDEGRGFDPRPGQTKDISIAASPLSTQHLRVRTKTRRLRVRIMCLGKMVCHPADCCFRELAR